MQGFGETLNGRVCTDCLVIPDKTILKSRKSIKKSTRVLKNMESLHLLVGHCKVLAWLTSCVPRVLPGTAF